MEIYQNDIQGLAGAWRRLTLKNLGMKSERRKKPKEESVRFWVTVRQWDLQLLKRFPGSALRQS